MRPTPPPVKFKKTDSLFRQYIANNPNEPELKHKTYTRTQADKFMELFDLDLSKYWDLYKGFDATKFELSMDLKRTKESIRTFILVRYDPVSIALVRQLMNPGREVV